MTHTLKTYLEYFEAILSGAKPFEVRWEENRRFEIGDHLVLQEWDPKQLRYTGRECRVEITYVLRGFAGLEPGVVVMGIRLDRQEDAQ